MEKEGGAIQPLFKEYFGSKCATCGGTRWVVTDGTARRCDCHVRDLDQSRKAFARIPEAYGHCTLGNFQPQNRKQHEVLQRASAFVKASDDPSVFSTGLLIRGAVGVGKTHLGMAVLKALIEKGMTGIFINTVHLIEQIKSSYDPERDIADPGILPILSRCHVVMMDELGTTRPTEFVFEKLYDIINFCFDRRISILFTTNYPDQFSHVKIGSATFEATVDGAGQPGSPMVAAPRGHVLSERIGERLRSRILAKCLDLTLEGADYRLKKRQIDSRFQNENGPPRIPGGARQTGAEGGT